MLLVVCVVAAILVKDDESKPSPEPTPTPVPPVPPPIPPNKNYNMYYLSANDTVTKKRHMITGNLRFQIPNMTTEDFEENFSDGDKI